MLSHSLAVKSLMWACIWKCLPRISSQPSLIVKALPYVVSLPTDSTGFFSNTRVFFTHTHSHSSVCEKTGSLFDRLLRSLLNSLSQVIRHTAFPSRDFDVSTAKCSRPVGFEPTMYFTLVLRGY